MKVLIEEIRTGWLGQTVLKRNRVTFGTLWHDIMLKVAHNYAPSQNDGRQFRREGTDSLPPATEENLEVTPRNKTMNVPSLTCYEAALSRTASSGMFVKNVGECTQQAYASKREDNSDHSRTGAKQIKCSKNK